MIDPVERARAAVREILSCYSEATTADEREQIARLASLLSPQGGRTISELGAAALETARRTS